MQKKTDLSEIRDQSVPACAVWTCGKMLDSLTHVFSHLLTCIPGHEIASWTMKKMIISDVAGYVVCFGSGCVLGVSPCGGVLQPLDHICCPPLDSLQSFTSFLYWGP